MLISNYERDKIVFTVTMCYIHDEYMKCVAETIQICKQLILKSKKYGRSKFIPIRLKEIQFDVTTVILNLKRLHRNKILKLVLKLNFFSLCQYRMLFINSNNQPIKSKINDNYKYHQNLLLTANFHENC